MKKSIIAIENTTILTMNENKDIIENGLVLIIDNKIDYIGNKSLNEIIKELKIETEIITIDGEEKILMPGMINCHTHVSMVPFRSLADDCKDRLKRYLFPLEQKLVDKELTYIGARYGIAEMLLGGVTTFCDMYYFEDEVARASKEMNMRAIVCETILDFAGPNSNKPCGGLEYSREFIKKWKDDDLITPGIAPHAIYTNSDEALKEAHKISREYDVPMMMHVSEMDYEVAESKQKYNLSPVEYLDKLGVLDSNFISAHTVLVDDNDIQILKNRDVKVSHNVGANSKGAKGVAPIIKMMKENINVGLGTDGPMSGNTLDIITQMAQVGKVHKLFNNDRTLLPAVEIVEMATIGGARVLGLSDEIGSIEVGKKADITIFETDSVNMQPIYDYYSTIAYSANPSNVDTVIVDGKIVVRGKKLVSGDFKEIRNNLIYLRGKIDEVAKTL